MMEKLMIGNKYADLVIGTTYSLLRRGFDCVCLSVGGKPTWVPNWAINWAGYNEREEYEEYNDI